MSTHKAGASGRGIRPGAEATDIACAALEHLRAHLASLARIGGGEVTGGLLQAAADDCPEPVIVTTREARIVMVNGAAARLLNTSTRELQRLSVWDITHADSQQDFDVLWREFLRAGRQRGVYSLRQTDGQPVAIAYCAHADVLPNRHAFVFRRLSESGTA